MPFYATSCYHVMSCHVILCHIMSCMNKEHYMETIIYQVDSPVTLPFYFFISTLEFASPHNPKAKVNGATASAPTNMKRGGCKLVARCDEGTHPNK